MKRNYFMHRISYFSEQSYPLLYDHNILSIGWGDLGYQDFVDDKKNFENNFVEVYSELSRNRFSLWNFIHEFKKGDWVIVPLWGGIFSVYKITGNKVLVKGDKKIKDTGINMTYKEKKKDIPVDLGFFWEVKPIEIDIPRYSYADSRLTSKMKFRQTNIWANDVEENILNAVKSFKDKKPINLYSDILEASRDSILKTIKGKLNPDKFEELIILYFKQCGASEVQTPLESENKEGDCDVQAIFENIKTIIQVQAKFHTGFTNEWSIDQIQKYTNKANDSDYTYASWVISTADNFTDEAKQKAVNNNVMLINGKDFVEMLLDAGISKLENNL